MNRPDWQQLAERWLVDAKSLLDNYRWSAAYYLAGYAVECGLKACVLAWVEATPELIFEFKNFSRDCWTHDVEELVKLANLETARVADMRANAALDRNWLVVKDWDENVRYKTQSQHKATMLHAAITHVPNGVMQWIRAHW